MAIQQAQVNVLLKTVRLNLTISLSYIQNEVGICRLLHVVTEKIITVLV